MILADALVVVVSVAFLNLSEKEQCPMYWLGLGWAGRGGTMGLIRSEQRRLRRHLADASEAASALFSSLFSLVSSEEAGGMNEALFGTRSRRRLAGAGTRRRCQWQVRMRRRRRCGGRRRGCRRQAGTRRRQRHALYFWFALRDCACCVVCLLIVVVC